MRIALLVCLLVAAGAAACSEQSAPLSSRGAVPSVQRIELMPARSAAPAPEPEVVASFHAGDQSVRWKAIAPSSAREQIATSADGGLRDALVVMGKGLKRIEIHGPFDPRTFNRVRLESAQQEGVNAQIVLQRKEGADLLSSTLRLPGQKTPSTVEFDLPGIRGETDAFDRLAVFFRRGSKRTSVLRIELLRVPLEAMFPLPAAPAELVRIGRHARRAKALSSRTPMEGSFGVERGARLAFSYGIPETIRSPEERLCLHVEITGERSAPLTREYPLESDPAVETVWHSTSIDLGAFAGERVRASFTVSGAREGVLAIGEPMLATVGEPAAAATVVLVTSDTHRADHLGRAVHGAGVRTPFLDSLAERGLFFEDCWTSTNVTQPSHAALLTGTSPRETGVISNGERLSDAAPTLAEAFRAAGYVTWAAVSVGHLDPRMSGLGQGFDRVSSPEEDPRDAGETIAELGAWIPDAEGMPLFVWLHVFDAHSPYEVSEEYERLYYPAGKDPRAEELPVLPTEMRPPWDDTIRDVDWIVAQYKSQITYLDEQLGLLFAHPRLAGAIIAVTADHGESLGAHGVHYSHAELYPDSLHVPLVLAWPGSPGGSRIEHPVEQIDVGRTLLDLAGLGERPFPGRDLTRLPAEPAVEPRFALSSDAISASVQAGRWLLILNLVDRSRVPRVQRALHVIELYDLETDPGCTRDLSASEREQAGKLRRLLADWLAGAPAEHWRDEQAALDEEEIGELAELGYASGDEHGRSSRWFDPSCDCESCRSFE